MENESVISIDDLRYVCIECPACHARVTLDMTKRTEFGEKNDYFAPNKCPGCHAGYDSAIQPGIDKLQKAYQALLALDAIAACVSFRAK